MVSLILSTFVSCDALGPRGDWRVALEYVTNKCKDAAHRPIFVYPLTAIMEDESLSEMFDEIAQVCKTLILPFVFPVSSSPCHHTLDKSSIRGAGACGRWKKHGIDVPKQYVRCDEWSIREEERRPGSGRLEIHGAD